MQNHTILGQQSQRLTCWLLFFTQFFYPVIAQTSPLERDDVEVSYIYTAVMGTGTYLIKNRRITMFRLPIESTQTKTLQDDIRLRWLLPVVFGYDDLDNSAYEGIEALLPDKIVILSALPGIEFIFDINSKWHLKTFLQIGGGRDFSINQSFILAQYGIKSINVYEIDSDWYIIFGNAIRFDGEYQLDSEDHTEFALFETGLEARHTTNWKIFSQSVEFGAYYIYQRFIPVWHLEQTPAFDSKIHDLHELGVSMNVKEGLSILGISAQGLRLGYKTGESFQGWTIGMDFPF